MQSPSLPFQPAAQGTVVTQRGKSVIVSDWNRTIELGGGRMNAPLLRFLSLAATHGHTVIVATKTPIFSDPEAMRESIRTTLGYYSDYIDPGYPTDFLVEFKSELRQRMAAMKEAGEIKEDVAMVVFDDCADEVTYPNAYLRAGIYEPVINGNVNKSHLLAYARTLGFEAEYREFLASSQPKGYGFDAK